MIVIPIFIPVKRQIVLKVDNRRRRLTTRHENAPVLPRPTFALTRALVDSVPTALTNAR
jgi:hypothetical protein